MQDRPGKPEPNSRDADPRPLVYVFQHIVLPDAVFENHPELIRDLSTGSTAPLLHFWSKARTHCERNGLLEPEDVDDSDASLAAEAAEDELIDATAIHPRRRLGHTVYVVTMPLPEASPEAYLSGVVHRDDEPHEYMATAPSSRYFTLELAAPGERPLLCEWSRDGRHSNYGEGPEPEVDAFAEAVFERLSLS